MQPRVRPQVRTLCALVLTLNACAPNEPPAAEQASTEPNSGQQVAQSGHSPPFESRRYAPFSRADAVRELAKNPGMIASFSRALLSDLRHNQDDAEFDRTLGTAIDEIHGASVA